MLKSTTQIAISTVYETNQAMTLIKVTIPLLPIELLKGSNLIDCIDPKALPANPINPI